jgi:hypothetical protein
MYVTGHYVPWIAIHAFLFGGMMISATLGYLYAQEAAGGYNGGALGGAIAGGGCALCGIIVSVQLGDTQPHFIALGTAICVVTGSVGGLYGQMSASIRAYFRKKM